MQEAFWKMTFQVYHLLVLQFVSFHQKEFDDCEFSVVHGASGLKLLEKAFLRELHFLLVVTSTFCSLVCSLAFGQHIRLRWGLLILKPIFVWTIAWLVHPSYGRVLKRKPPCSSSKLMQSSSKDQNRRVQEVTQSAYYLVQCKTMEFIIVALIMVQYKCVIHVFNIPSSGIWSFKSRH